MKEMKMLLVFVLLIISTCGAKENRGRQLEAFLSCSQTFREIDALFSEAISTGDENSVVFRRDLDTIVRVYAVADFQYSLLNDGSEIYVFGKNQTISSTTFLAHLYTFRQTFPPGIITLSSKPKKFPIWTLTKRMITEKGRLLLLAPSYICSQITVGPTSNLGLTNSNALRSMRPVFILLESLDSFLLL